MAALGGGSETSFVAFHERLFTVVPETRRLFVETRAQFAAELASIATVIRRHDTFLATRGDLGRRHSDAE